MNKRKKITIAGIICLLLLFLTAIVLADIIDYTPVDKLFELIAEKQLKTKSEVREFIMSATVMIKPDSATKLAELEYLYSNTFIMKKESNVPYIISLIGDEEDWHLFALPESRGPYMHNPIINKILLKVFGIDYYQASLLNGNTYKIRKY